MARSRSHLFVTVVAVAVAALMLGACNGGSDGNMQSGGDSGPVKVKDATGTTVKLDAPALRVVALEWTYAEDLLALGITPVGVADPKNYALYVDGPALPTSVADVGTRQEPSLERIAALDPDLIIGTTFRNLAGRDQLEDRAPVLLFDPYPTSGDHLEEMKSTFRAIATAVGRSDKAEKVLDELDATIATAAKALDGAGLKRAEVALAQGYAVNNRIAVRMFTDNSMAIHLLEQIGLQNGWPGLNEQYGFNTVDLEALTKLGDVRFLSIQPVGGGSDPFAVLNGNPLWENLPFVKAKHLYVLPADTWTYGGPVSAEILIERVVDQLT